MPISKYNRYFGGEKGSAAKAKRGMANTYGERGEEVFYRTINKKKGRHHPRVGSLRRH
ncbi:MAG: hypothetical protein GY906_22535 [bacterium]|nr:hypothetical protein [bacterium]